MSPRLVSVETFGMVDLIRPPAFVLHELVLEAQRSPCAKSQRGVLIVDPHLVDKAAVEGGEHRVRESILSRGHNAPPAPMTCGGHTRGPEDTVGQSLSVSSLPCRASCGKVAEHAEAAALRWLDCLHPTRYYGLHMIHGELAAGETIAACDGPSCWQCSKAILADGRISIVWLYENYIAAEPRAGVIDRVHALRWRAYSALDFHCATLRHPKNNLYCRSEK